MSYKNFKALKPCTWNEVRPEVKKVNPLLAKIIDAKDPSNGYKLYLSAYPYGHDIIREGELYVSDPHFLNIPLREAEIDPKIKADFDYTHSLPLGIVLKKGVENYLSFKNRIMTYSRYAAGELIGLVKSLDGQNAYLNSSSLWHMSSGVRSTFMLPKISDESAHLRLKNFYKFNQSKPATLGDHWEVFKAIANAPNSAHDWSCQLVFFGKKWFEHQHDPAWTDFNYYLLQQAWQRTQYRRNLNFLNIIASILQTEKNIKVSLSTLELVMHLMAIALGETPGFRASLNDEFMPTSLIQDAYTNIYGLNYAPIIMEPSKFKLLHQNEPPVYYSFNYPSALLFSPKKSKNSSTVSDLYEVGRILSKFCDEIATNRLNIKETELHSFAKHCKFRLFHQTHNDYSEIYDPKILAQDDPSFMAAFNNTHYLFPKSSIFFNGCIRISKTE